MIDLTEWVAGRYYALQITTWQQWVLRLLMLAAGAGAAWLSAAWVAPVLLTPWALVTAAVLLACVLWPDSVLPLLVVVLVALPWFGGGAEGPWWRQLTVVALSALFHLTAAYCALAPTFATITGRLGQRLTGAVAAFVAGSAVVAGLSLLLAG